ncbi:hypothetical protein OsI_00509 [Oryza sativa Indica Group]|uniref:Uncharacterized protein n=1 Tax=Oryza sativa subsp. indica TaxID=39946 RepID=A2WKZ7_ORYSI|nr:hypothetical protein OsI_00509 [Oryza sativa Indica Group]
MTKQTDGTGHPSSDPLIADCNICLKSATSGTLDTISPSSPPTSSSPPYNLMPHSGEVQVVAVITDWDVRDRLRWGRRTARGGSLAAAGGGAAAGPPGPACDALQPSGRACTMQEREIAPCSPQGWPGSGETPPYCSHCRLRPAAAHLQFRGVAGRVAGKAAGGGTWPRPRLLFAAIQQAFRGPLNISGRHGRDNDACTLVHSQFNV